MQCFEKSARLRARIERELRSVALGRDRSYPKRIKTQTDARNAAFETNMLKLKMEWAVLINELVKSVSNIEIYDKLTSDLKKSFIKIHHGHSFESDQLDYAIRCTIMPVCGQMMDENGGPSAAIWQERRVHLLKSSLEGVVLKLTRPVAVIDLTDTSRSSESSNSTPSTLRSSASSANSLTQEEIELTPPDFFTVTILDILFGAIERHSDLCAKNYSYRDRILHIVNISFIVDILTKYLDDVSKQLKILRAQEELTTEHMSKWIKVLRDPMIKYKEILRSCTELLDNVATVSYFRKQLDSLLYRVISICSELKD